MSNVAKVFDVFGWLSPAIITNEDSSSTVLGARSRLG
jgi:hypothetical protein